VPTEAVLDSSVITALVTTEECSDWAQKKTGEHEYFHILDLSYYEVANAIKHKTSARFGAKDAVKAFDEAAELMNLYAVHSFSEVVADAMALALELNITAYDAAFLSLANRLDMPFVTLDAKLVKKLECTRYSGLVECP
jgi:predicted nucleic acid-binding protein